ncbi:MAG: polysaccharide biosynthesis/export family protein [Armatimonadota bacterium]
MKTFVTIIIVIYTIFTFTITLFAQDDSSTQILPDYSSKIDSQTSEQAVNAYVDEKYKITEEDVIRIDVWGDPVLSRLEVQVTPDGNINIPYLGIVRVVGMTQLELTDHIIKRLIEEEIYYEPRVQVTLLKIHDKLVRVLGQVRNPGAIKFRDGDTLLEALAQAGSYTENAWLERTSFTRKESDDLGVPAGTPVIVNLKDLLDGKNLTQNFLLKNGDTIYIPPEDYNNKIYVMGYVMKPGIFSLKDNTTVVDAITLAGGQSQRGSLSNITIIRGGSPENPENRIKVDLNKFYKKGDFSQNITLEAGDVIMVPETKAIDWTKVSQILNSALNVLYLDRYLNR